MPSSAINFDEVNLKQVKLFLLGHSVNQNMIINWHLFFFPFCQAQDSPDNSMFSFQLGNRMKRPHQQNQQHYQKMPKPNFKNFCFFWTRISAYSSRMLPIRIILMSLKDQLLESIKEALIHAAFIESHQVQVLRAQKWLADRLQQEQIIKKTDDLKSLMDSTRAKIDSLTQSRA